MASTAATTSAVNSISLATAPPQKRAFVFAANTKSAKRVSHGENLSALPIRPSRATASPNANKETATPAVSGAIPVACNAAVASGNPAGNVVSGAGMVPCARSMSKCTRLVAMPRPAERLSTTLRY